MTVIDERNARAFCCEDISLIENYDKAAADKTQTWDTHHRRETDEGISKRELIRRGEYIQRPASELIFLPHDEHVSLHHSGEKNHFFGKHLPAEMRRKMSLANRGRHPSEETREKLRQLHLGKHWYNDGTRSIKAVSCPPGFHPGRL